MYVQAGCCAYLQTACCHVQAGGLVKLVEGRNEHHRQFVVLCNQGDAVAEEPPQAAEPELSNSAQSSAGGGRHLACRRVPQYLQEIEGCADADILLEELGSPKPRRKVRKHRRRKIKDRSEALEARAVPLAAVAAASGSHAGPSKDTGSGGGKSGVCTNVHALIACFHSMLSCNSFWEVKRLHAAALAILQER
jgi:hypothetical protein